jgi:molybdenum cofactor biosynthesis enzyme MoaA
MLVCHFIHNGISVKNVEGKLQTSICCKNFLPSDKREEYFQNGCPYANICNEYKIDVTETNIQDLTLNIAYKCNFDCIYCGGHVGKNTIDELNLSSFQVYNYLKDEMDFNKIRQIFIGGGEFFIDKNLRDLLKIIITNHPNVKIFLATNGYYWDEEILKPFENNLKGIHLSVYGKDNETYQKTCGTINDGFTQVIEINYLKILYLCKTKNLSFKIRLNACIIDDENEWIPDFINYIREINPLQTIEIFNASGELIKQLPWEKFEKVYCELYKNDENIFLEGIENSKFNYISSYNCCKALATEVSLQYLRGQLIQRTCSMDFHDKYLDRYALIQNRPEQCKTCFQNDNSHIYLGYITRCNFSFDCGCNFRCKFCIATKGSSNEKPEILYQRIKNECDLSHIKTFEWSNGEYFFDTNYRYIFNKLLDDYPDTKMWLATNGYLWDETVVEKYKKRIEGLVLSIYGDSNEEYKKTCCTIENGWDIISENIQKMYDFCDYDGYNSFHIRINYFKSSYKWQKDLVLKLHDRYPNIMIRVVNVEGPEHLDNNVYKEETQSLLNIINIEVS